MGLDQYWNIIKGDKKERLYYHRKVPALQAFMKKEWEALGNEGDFNLDDLPITVEILDRLDEAIKNKSLDENATGFFFGQHQDIDYLDIKVACDKARRAISRGEQVVYSSWW